MIKKLCSNIESTIDKIFGGHFSILPWYGWENPNSCCFAYFTQSFFGKNKNFGFLILPVKPWLHVHFEHVNFGTAKRICVGIGIVSFFWDYRTDE